MTALVPVEDVIDLLGGIEVVTEDETPVLDRVLTQVEALFLAQANRRHRPFQDAQASRTEVRDGTGSNQLMLHYPLTALVSVLVGADPNAPDETLAINDPKVLRYGAGGSLLTRVDGGTFGAADDPRVVHITYHTAADLPQDAALAIANVTVAFWRRRGSEDTTTERLGGFQADFTTLAAGDPLWQLALKGHTLPGFAQ